MRNDNISALYDRYVNGPFESHFFTKRVSFRMADSLEGEWSMDSLACDIGLTDGPISGPWFVFEELPARLSRPKKGKYTLHRDLADLYPTISPLPTSIPDFETVATFAKKHGPLGWRAFTPANQSRGRVVRGGKVDPVPYQHAESAWDWLWHIMQLRGLVELVHAYKDETFRWRYGPTMLSSRVENSAPDDVREYLSSRAYCVDVWPDMVSNDLFPIDWFFFQYLGYYLPMLCRPSFDLRRDNPLYLMTTTLIGRAYTDLADELIPGTIPPRKCPGCQRWFRPNVGQQRHCDESCKTTANRRKKALPAGGQPRGPARRINILTHDGDE